MQIKTINKVIKTKLTEWINSITDKELSESLKNNILLSGGSITSMLLGEKVNDYDIYIMDRTILKKLVEYYTQSYDEIIILDGEKKQDLIYKLEQESGEEIKNIHNAYAISLRNLKEDQIKLFFESKNGGIKVNEDIPSENLNYTPLFFSPNAISLSNEIQIVIRFWGNSETIHKTFDFIHATNYFTFETGVVTNTEALESILTKQLKYQGSLYPVTSIIRSKKFLKRGWNCSAGELLKMIFQASQLDLTNPDVLDEQLVGVDVAYFATLINVLRNKFENDKDFKPSVEFFNELIDKIFNESETLE